MAGIDDAVLAFDFDLACTIRINQHDSERDAARVKAQAKLTAAYCLAMFNGTDPDDNNGDDTITNIDPETEVW